MGRVQPTNPYTAPLTGAPPAAAPGAVSQSQKKAAAQLAGRLAATARPQQLPAAMPQPLQELSAVDLLAEFLKVSPDRKGIMSAGYGSAGWELETSIGVDPSAFFLPGLFNFGAEASLGVGTANALILAAHHAMPRRLPAADVVGAVRWSSGAPLALLSLFGRSFSLKVAANVSLGASVEIPTGSETADEAAAQFASWSEIPLALGVEASVSASLSYDRLYARDVAPRWYCDPLDQRLRSDFYNLLFPSKTLVKRTSLNWISTLDSQVFALTGPALDALIHDPARQRALFIDAIIGQYRRGVAPSRLTAELRAGGQRFRQMLPATDFLITRFVAAVRNLQTRLDTTEGLLNVFNSLKWLMPTEADIAAYFARPRPAGGPTAGEVWQAAQGITRQVYFLEERLRALRPESPEEEATIPADRYYTPAQLGSPNRYNCFLKIASHAAAAEAGVKAQVILFGANAGVSGQYKRTAYRYQTVCPGRGGSLIYTQDTSITYRLATVSGRVGTAFYGAGLEKSFVSGMTYQSACVYWIYEEAARRPVTPQVGSGLSYGVSVRTDELQMCIAEVQRQNPTARPDYAALPALPATLTSRPLIYRLSRYLRVSYKFLTSLLASPNMTAAAMATWPPAVLLESSFVLPSSPGGLTVLRRAKRESPTGEATEFYRLDGILAQPVFQAHSTTLNTLPQAYDNCAYYLQSLRIRGRMADFSESSVAFKLGVPVAPVPGVTLGIQLANIKKAGQEGVMDLFSRHYRGDDDDGRVPPVALFHQ